MGREHRSGGPTVVRAPEAGDNEGTIPRSDDAGRPSSTQSIGEAMYLYHKVEEITVSTSDSRHAIGAFILREHAHLSQYTIADIAEATFTSKPSITRFAKHLGFDGWRDFIRAFMAEELGEKDSKITVDPNFPFRPSDSDETIIQNIGDLQAAAIADTYDHLDRAMLRRAVRYLDAARIVRVFGLSPNCYVADLFCRKLVTIGKQASVVTAGETGIQSRALGRQDCAIFISYSGNTDHSSRSTAISTLMERGVSLIGITGAGDNFVRQTIPCTLTISSHERLYNKIANYSTEESINYLLNILFSCVFARNYERNLQYRLESSRVLEGERSVHSGDRPSEDDAEG